MVFNGTALALSLVRKLRCPLCELAPVRQAVADAETHVIAKER